MGASDARSSLSCSLFLNNRSDPKLSVPHKLPSQRKSMRQDEQD